MCLTWVKKLCLKKYKYNRMDGFQVPAVKTCVETEIGLIVFRKNLDAKVLLFYIIDKENCVRNVSPNNMDDQESLIYIYIYIYIYI